VNLFQISVRLKTKIFEVKIVNSRRLRSGSAEGFGEKTGIRAATDLNAIEPLPVGASGKLLNVGSRIAREGKHGRRGSKN